MTVLVIIWLKKFARLRLRLKRPWRAKVFLKHLKLMEIKQQLCGMYKKYLIMFFFIYIRFFVFDLCAFHIFNFKYRWILYRLVNDGFYSTMHVSFIYLNLKYLHFRLRVSVWNKNHEKCVIWMHDWIFFM